MRKVDMHWMSNYDWWDIKDEIPVVREDAPPEAKESYKRYLIQLHEGYLIDRAREKKFREEYGDLLDDDDEDFEDDE